MATDTQEPSEACALQLVANVGEDPCAQWYLPLGQHWASTEAAVVTAQAEQSEAPVPSLKERQVKLNSEPLLSWPSI